MQRIESDALAMPWPGCEVHRAKNLNFILAFRFETGFNRAPENLLYRMSAKQRPVAAGKAAPVLRKRLPALKHAVPVWLLRRAEPWVLRTFRKKEGRSVVELADEAGVGAETLREYECGKHPDAWTTACKVCHALGRYPDYVEKLVRRFMTKSLRRQEYEHRGETDWKLKFPWDKPDEKVNPDMSGWQSKSGLLPSDHEDRDQGRQPPNVRA